VTGKDLDLSGPSPSAKVPSACVWLRQTVWIWADLDAQGDEVDEPGDEEEQDEEMKDGKQRFKGMCVHMCVCKCVQVCVCVCL